MILIKNAHPILILKTPTTKIFKKFTLSKIKTLIFIYSTWQFTLKIKDFDFYSLFKNPSKFRPLIIYYRNSSPRSQILNFALLKHTPTINQHNTPTSPIQNHPHTPLFSEIFAFSYFGQTTTSPIYHHKSALYYAFLVDQH